MIECDKGTGTPIKDLSASNNQIAKTNAAALDTLLKDQYTGLMAESVCVSYQVVIIDIATGNEVDMNNLSDYDQI